LLEMARTWVQAALELERSVIGAATPLLSSKSRPGK
jgi:hypothetical protein